MKIVFFILTFTLIGCATNKERNYLSKDIDSLNKESLSRQQLDKNAKDFGEILLSNCYKDENFDVRVFSRKKLDQLKETFGYWSSIGSCYLHKGEAQKGLFFYKLSLGKVKSKAHKAIYYNNLGVFYTKANRLDTAIEFFNKSIETKSSYKTPHMNLAMIYTQYKLNNKAKKHLSYFRGSKDPHIKYLGLIIESNAGKKSTLRKIAGALPSYLTPEEKEETLERIYKN